MQNLTILNYYYRIGSLFHPDRYHGWGRKRRYFEGWYFKLVNESENESFAIIPGIAMDENGKSHAFIQLLDGTRQEAGYFTFPTDSFKASSNSFHIQIGESTFSLDQIKLNLPELKGTLRIQDVVPWPNKWYSPGIMGPYSFVPFMECYHGVLSMNHTLKGKLRIRGKDIDFTGGRGYIEKDWGHSFPSAYFWMQSNHFSSPGISLKASVANIPWLGSSFVGFIAGLYVDNQLFEFTTYNRTKLSLSVASKRFVKLRFENSRHTLEITAYRNAATELASPITGFMDGRISESMSSRLDVQLSEHKSGKVVFKDTGRNVALEVAGRIEEISVRG